MQFLPKSYGWISELNCQLSRVHQSRNISQKFRSSRLETWFGVCGGKFAMGVFPSARMAMYHDLDPEQPGFPESEIIDSLLGGTNAESASPFADEYKVDDPEIERKVPYLVMDAHSSQFSTLVDVAEGKNLAVEGPPGTGKSQTIVNAIAAAIAEGKKNIVCR